MNDPRDLDGPRREKLWRLLDLLEAETAAGRSEPAGEPAVPEVDLRTLLGEVTALKAAVRAETSAAREVRDQLTQGAEDLRHELERAARREEALRAEAERGRRAEARRSALELVELIDRLEPAVEHARDLARPRWRWLTRRRDPSAVSLLEGLELSLQRLSRKLGERGLTRVTTVGHLFDPTVMEAVDTVELAAVPEGRVVAEVSAGYVSSEGVLRAAQVVVNRRFDQDEED